MVDLQQGVSHFSLIFHGWERCECQAGEGRLSFAKYVKDDLAFEGQASGLRCFLSFVGDFCASFWDQRYFTESSCQSFLMALLSRAVV